MGSLDHLSPVPLWRQLADLLAEDIRAGRLAVGDLLPSETALQQTHGISRGTVRHALAELQERGLITTIQARGSRVTQRPE